MRPDGGTPPRSGCRGPRAAACEAPSPGWLVAVIVAVCAAGCARAPVAPDREPFAEGPPQTVSPAELRQRLAAGSADVRSLRAKLDLGLRESGGRYRTCRGTLAASSPWSGEGSPGVYLQGHRSPLPALFTLVSDARRFWLHVPGENVVYTGPVAARRAASGDRGPPVDARDLFRALFLEPVDDADDVEVDEEPERYVVSVVHAGRTVRRIWVDRRGLVVRREVFLDGEGRGQLVIDRERYRALAGRLYPARIQLTDPATGSAVRLEFESVALDPADLKPDAFRPRTPPGARVERVPGEGEET